MSRTLKFAIALFFIPLVSFADDNQRLHALEAQVKELNARVAGLETTLDKVRRGGFTLTPIVTCEIKTDFDGAYVASELSKSASLYSVIERCKAKAKNKAQCDTSRAVCK